MTEDETVGWHHQLEGHEFEQALVVGDGQGSLVCCSPWGHKEVDMTEQLTTHILMGVRYDLIVVLICISLRPSPWKRNAKKQNGCRGGLTNSCEKKRGEKQRRKGKI